MPSRMTANITMPMANMAITRITTTRITRTLTTTIMIMRNRIR